MNKITYEDIKAIASECHQAAVATGWWTDLESGESTIGKRDFIQMSGLSMTEVYEAFEGGQCPDDKIPTMDAFVVELADTFIREADKAGGCGVDLEAAFGRMRTGIDLTHGALVISPDTRSMQHRAVASMLINGEICKAIEHHRKRRIEKRDDHVARALVVCFQVASQFGYQLEHAIDAKLAFNADRPDHKLENRAKDGGKKE